jgi:thiol-disulfide isomerase/thioredoxin
MMEPGPKIRAPRFSGGQWLNTEQPPSLEGLTASGIVLVDFWEYTCVNCIRTLPYLVAWHERYHHLGLNIVGIHTPEFDISEQPEAVAAAIRRFDIPYPVLLDNESTNWDAYANRAWPTKYLVDRNGIIRYTAQGEGRYAETEAAIQTLLTELHGGDLNLPPLMQPLRPTDAPGAVCYRATPELHAGYASARPGSADSLKPSVPQQFHPVSERDEGQLYFEGLWRPEHNYSETVEAGCVLRVPYRAAELNVVLASADGQPQRLFLRHDGQTMTMDEAGEDVVVDSDWGSYVLVRAPRLYNLVVNPDFARHEITLESNDVGLRVYAFSFVSCTKPAYEDGDLVVP